MYTYTVCKNGINGLCKSPCILINKGNESFVVAYIKKPKWLSNNAFNTVVDAIRLNLTSCGSESILDKACHSSVESRHAPSSNG